MIKLSNLIKESSLDSLDLFRIVKKDGNARHYMGLFKAKDENEAKSLAADHYNNPSISESNDYIAEWFSPERLKDEKEKYTKELIGRTKIMN